MRSVGWWLVLALMVAPGAFAQEGCDDGCGCDDACGCADIVTDEDIVDGSGGAGIEIDPFEQVAVVDEPNRPPAVKVGVWPPPKLDAGQQAALDALVKERDESPDDVVRRYRLADAYARHRWWPHAEAEYLACVKLDPKSIRPWESLLRVYRAVPRSRQDEINEILRQLQAAGGAAPAVINLNGARNETDWLPSAVERTQRTTYAYVELLRRRPDDLSRRRAFLAHLIEARDYERILVEARLLIERLPDDPAIRYELAEAVRRRGATKEKREKGSGEADMAEAIRLLEENVRRAPEHAASALRLARILAAREGSAASARIQELEERAYFHLFVKREIATIPFRPDTHRMARELGGRAIARTLWDGAMVPPWYENRRLNGERVVYQRWISDIRFPNPQARDLLAAFKKHARRGDREAAGMLLSYLWHLEAAESYPTEAQRERENLQRLEDGAVAAALRLGGACYAAAERFLLAAERPHHRRRAVRVLSGLRDRRAVRPLLDALAWDTDEAMPLGVAGALEDLGDPRAVAALVEAARDVRRPRARRLEAVEALAAFQDPRCIEALNMLVKEEGFELAAQYGLFRLTRAAPARAALAAALQADDPVVALRLVAKCDGASARDLFVEGLAKAQAAIRPRIAAILHERYWASVKDKVKPILLAEAKDGAAYAFDLLAEIGGDDVVDTLLGVVRSERGVVWAKAARALAQTGDARAVKYFNRARVLEREPSRRRLAETLFEVASRRRAELSRAAGDSEKGE